MNVRSVLEPTLKEILNVINPLREDSETRLVIIHELQDVVDSVESLRGATVEPFGSYVSNLFTRWGDLDISIELPNGSHISSAGKKRKQNLLAELLRALRQRGGYRRLQFISNARVPILKLEDRQNISCDISIDNLPGQMKSKFLLWINEIDGRFRDMVLLVKEWAKANDINNPKTGTLNSYSLSLLVIFHFQTCVPAILPPLKDIYPGNLVHELKGVRAVAEAEIRNICATSIARIKSDKSRNINRSSLSALFVSFLQKFSDISLKASELGICPFTGRWETIASNMRWLPHNHALFIEDPFEQPENCARAVSDKQLTKISNAFAMTYNRLTSENYGRNSLLDMLARPQISYSLSRTGVSYPSYKRGQLRTHPQVQNAVHSPSMGQQQTSKKRMENRPNKLVSQQPGLQYHSQSVQQHHNHHLQRNQGQYHSQFVQQHHNHQLQRNQSQPVPRIQSQHVQRYQSQPVRQYQSQGQVHQIWRPKPDK